MDHSISSRCVAAVLAGLIFGGTAATQTDTTTFAPPVQLRAGDKFLGEKRLYPSPVFHDVNGDRRLDLVIGDLPGKLTWAAGAADGSFAAEQPLMGAGNQPLKFHNW